MNNFSNILAFIKAWDGQVDSTYIEEQRFVKSPLNNINYTGDPTSDAAVIFTKSDSLFYNAIEDGVILLVSAIINQFDWITFSSCAGHLGYKNQAYKKRMVQLLPRNHDELVAIMNILTKSAYQVNSKLACMYNPINIKILTESLASDNVNYSSIKLVFEGGNISEQEYFNYIDEATKLLVKQLNDVR